MRECLKCGKEARYEFRVLEVQTLHLRDFTGESRVQALGEMCTYSICDSCAESQMEQALNPGGRLLGGCWKYLALIALGILLTVILWQGSALRILGPAAIVCGILGLAGTLRTAGEQKKAYASLSPEEAKERAAWDVLMQAAPKKSEDSDLTYIPITPKTLAMKNGDLMIAYDLLPEIAVKAHKMIHGEKEALR